MLLVGDCSFSLFGSCRSRVGSGGILVCMCIGHLGLGSLEGCLLWSLFLGYDKAYWDCFGVILFSFADPKLKLSDQNLSIPIW